MTEENREIEEYTLIRDHSVEYYVNKYIKEGWQPFGSPYQDRDGENVQAMVKYKQAFKTYEEYCKENQS